MTEFATTVLGALVGLAATVVLVIWSRRGGTPRGGRALAVGLAAVTVVLVVLAGRLVLSRAGVPYNLRELFETSNPIVALSVFAIAMLLFGFAPMLLALDWERDPGRFLRRGALLTLVAAAAIAIPIALTAPEESLGDITGTPVFRSVALLERTLRLVALLLGVLAGLAIGVRVAGAHPRVSDWRGLLPLLLLAALSWVVVVPLAGTDNLTELLRGGGGVGAMLGVAGFLVLLGCTAALPARGLAARSPKSILAGLIAVVCSIPPAWSLMVLATDPMIYKYEKMFSARQFLLSPDRDSYLPDAELLPRFALAWVAVALVLSIGMTISTLLFCKPDER